VNVRREGGCACGAVRYRLTSDPLIAHRCHCLNCQRQTGSASRRRKQTARFPVSELPSGRLQPQHLGNRRPNPRIHVRRRPTGPVHPHAQIDLRGGLEVASRNGIILRRSVFALRRTSCERRWSAFGASSTSPAARRRLTVVCTRWRVRPMRRGICGTVSGRLASAIAPNTCQRADVRPSSSARESPAASRRPLVCYAHPDHSGRDCEAPLLLRGAPARPIRFDDETIAKGYRRDQFEASGPVTSVSNGYRVTSE
jgi:hypothetical protein